MFYFENFLEDYEQFSQTWWPYIITFTISLVFAIRLYVGGTHYQNNNRLDGKNVIVTGGSSGLGLATARELAQRGANVILAVRNAEKGRNAIETIRLYVPDANVIVKLLDVSDFSGIRDFTNQLKNEYDKIDILINNAGIFFHPYCKTVDGNETTFATNYLGPFLLTHLLLPLLNKSDNGRVINVSSLAHYSGKIKLDDLNSERQFSEREAFSQSKLALTIFTKTMASLCKKTNITFNSASPGLVRDTDHFKNSTFQKSLWTRISVWPWMWLLLKTPRQGAQTILYLAVEPSLKNVSGCYFSDCEIRDPAEVVNDTNLGQLLYEKSCLMTSIDSKKILNDIIESARTF